MRAEAEAFLRGGKVGVVSEVPTKLLGKSLNVKPGRGDRSLAL
jgi:hypothetical protein